MIVPRYQSQLTQNTVGVNYNTPVVQGAFGGNVAQATEGFSNALMGTQQVLAKQQREQMEKDNVEKVQTALAGYTKEMNDYHYNPNDGFLHREGTQAQGIANQSKTFSEALAYKYAKDLTNPVQQQTFLKAADNQAQSFYSTAQNYESKQNQIAQKQANDAMTTNYQNTVTTAYKNPETADSVFRQGINGLIAYHKSQGTPDVAIKQAVKAYGTDTITKMVQTALSNNDIQGAQNVLNHYGYDETKIDGATRDVLQSTIDKKALPIQAQQISDKLIATYGKNERAGRDALKEQFGNDPNYKILDATYQANMADNRRIESQEKQQAQESAMSRMWKSSSLAQAQADIRAQVDNGTLTPDQGLALIGKAKTMFSGLESKDPMAKRWATYQNNGGLDKDLQLAREYQENMDNPDFEMTPEKQTKYNNMAVRLNQYWDYTSGGQYSQKLEQSKQEEAKAQESQTAEQGIWDSINALATKGLTRDQIIERINVVAPRYGFEPNYFIENADWSTQGNQKGGAK